MSIGSLFAGIGGFDLAARWMGWSTKWVSEIDPYASAVLKKHFPVPNHGDITRIKGTDVEQVDLLCGGFPCQDISLAGKGAGIEGSRSGLWSHYARLIEEIRPRYIVAENVSALRMRGLERVLEDLMALGYDAEWHCVPACAVGAPHRRDRIWIVGYPAGSVHGDDHRSRPEGSGTSAPAGPMVTTLSSLRGSRLRGQEVADAIRTGSQGHTRNGDVVSELGRLDPRQNGSVGAQSVRDGGYPEGWWDTEPNVGRVADGVPARVHRIRCLGNAIVPQVAFAIFQGIQRFESALTA